MVGNQENQLKNQLEELEDLEELEEELPNERMISEIVSFRSCLS